MAKKKRKKTVAGKKKISRLQIFLSGVFVGISLLTLANHSDFSKVSFSFSSPTSNVSPFGNHLPLTTPTIEREGHLLAYDGRTRNAHWVYHRLTQETVEEKISRKSSDFHEDPLIPSLIRATKSDYQNSGYDRGHLCPASDSATIAEMNNSFFLTNISPQVPAFNRGYWKKVENHIRDLTKQYAVVHVFAGPLYLKQKGAGDKYFVKYEVIGPNDVAVPTHFFSLIFVEDKMKKLFAKAYILPNKSIAPKTSLSKFSASLEDVESASGVIFTQLSSENYEP